ncbi:hypothetical protein [Dyadobacter alkalitolerans]|uniref:hypothetical protein n=1 Tax=Dyadobacter alkalitolerans TaxID=492736 RepID=UPI00047ECB6F|nr:hypothetical protein [Dyadobacter alkalitolerans]
MMRILAFLVLLTISKLSAQDPPKNAKVIIVSTDTTQLTDVYRALARHLIDQGYALAKTDKELGLINTERKAVKGSIELRILTSIRRKEVHFTGKHFLSRFDKSESDIVNFGMRGSLNKITFNELDKVAKSLPNVSVRYEQ